MRALTKILIAAISSILLLSCAKTLNEDITGELRSGAFGMDKTHETKMVTTPFMAHFYTKRDYSKEGEGPAYCTEGSFTAINYQVGEGESTHLGHFSTQMQFCGAGFDYKNLQSVLVAANGDELWLTLPEGTIGHVILYTPADIVYPYEAHFEDPFIITGGTGRFEGASGGGMMNSKVNLFEDDGTFIPEHQTDHVWTGTITLKKGK